MPKLENSTKKSVNTIIGALLSSGSSGTTSTSSGGGVISSTVEAVLCQAATAESENITLPNATSIDGYTLVDDDIVLLRSQTDVTQNGLYAHSAGILAAVDFSPPPLLFISQFGAENSDTLFIRVSDDLDPLEVYRYGLPMSSSESVLFGDSSGGWDVSTSAFCTGASFKVGIVEMLATGLIATDSAGNNTNLFTDTSIVLTDVTNGNLLTILDSEVKVESDATAGLSARHRS